MAKKKGRIGPRSKTERQRKIEKKRKQDQRRHDSIVPNQLEGSITGDTHCLSEGLEPPVNDNSTPMLLSVGGCNEMATTELDPHVTHQKKRKKDQRRHDSTITEDARSLSEGLEPPVNDNSTPMLLSVGGSNQMTTAELDPHVTQQMLDPPEPSFSGDSAPIILVVDGTDQTTTAEVDPHINSTPMFLSVGGSNQMTIAELNQHVTHQISDPHEPSFNGDVTPMTLVVDGTDQTTTASNLMLSNTEQNCQMSVEEGFSVFDPMSDPNEMSVDMEPPESISVDKPHSVSSRSFFRFVEPSSSKVSNLMFSNTEQNGQMSMEEGLSVSYLSLLSITDVQDHQRKRRQDVHAALRDKNRDFELSYPKKMRPDKCTEQPEEGLDVNHDSTLTFLSLLSIRDVSDRQRKRRQDVHAALRDKNRDFELSYPKKMRPDECCEQPANSTLLSNTEHISQVSVNISQVSMEEGQQELHAALIGENGQFELSDPKKSEDQLKRRKEVHASNMQKSRAKETAEQRERRLKKASEYKESMYQNETPSMRKTRLRKKAENMQQIRREESEGKRALRHEKDRNRHRAQAQSKKNTYKIPLARDMNPQVEPFYLGPMTEICEYCSAFRFAGESKNCCQKGKIKIEDLSPYPEEMKDLLTNNHDDSEHFHENIRQYNSAFSFVSMGAKIAPPPGYGPYCFRIHGQVYHRSGTLHPRPGEQPQYAQVYIMEAKKAVECRMNRKENVKCRNDIMELLDGVMKKYSPFVKAYKHMHQVEEEENTKATEENRSPSTVQMVIKRGKDRRRYNEPTHDEVAAVFVGHDGAPPANRDFIVYPRNKPCTHIKDISSNCDPMTYPVFFPRGDPGWIYGEKKTGPNASKKAEQTAGKKERSNGQESKGKPGAEENSTRNNVTHLQYYSYRLAVRSSFSPLHYGGKLFQQYLVDGYVKMEGNRLNYIRTKQKQLRAELYQGLMDHVHSRAEDLNLTPGKIIILPSSYPGSPRAMQQNYQDAMSIVSKFGKPDVFLTYTCNAKSPEIVENLFPGQNPSDRPDIVARVYNLHLKELLDDIMNKDVLGKVLAMVRVIEFQKRGLPHCHMLLIMDEESKIRNEDDIDRIICAEIPDPEEDPALYEVIQSCMMHGPCAEHGKECACIENGICTKGYPKEFNEETTMGANSYPEYRRRNNGRTVTKKGVDLDNRYVVPFNRYLSKKYRAHINVEACTSIKSVKYLFKYIYKGHDCASIEVTETGVLNHDEITTHVDTRYVSPPEAMWHMSAYKMHEQSHAIIRLAVHLPFQQVIYFEEGQEETALKNAEGKNTTLTAWFKLNKEDEDAKKFLYPELPTHYVFDKESHKWKKRKLGAGKVIGRMYSASPNDSERFHLRLLLLHVPGATSFEYLRTYNGQTVQTFKEACRLHQLLEDDTEWHRTLEEASTFQMPWQLRLLFATISSHNHPSNPLELWQSHKEFMVEDLLQEFSQDEAENLALHYIQEIVQQNRVSYKDLGLPVVNPVRTSEEPLSVEDDERYVAEMLKILNKEQREVVDSILAAVGEVEEGAPPRCRAFFLEGVGGSGKTTVYNTLMAMLRIRGHQIDPCAWTGLAATLLRGGKTVHATFKLPVPLTENSTSSVTPTSKEGAKLKNTLMFIIDEASMLPKHALHAIDILLQDLTGAKVPFGGKPFVMGGNYFQVLPILPRSRRTAVIENTLIRSHLWPQIQKMHLTKNMRAKSDQQEFADWLLKLGNGELKTECKDAVEGSIDIPERCVVEGNIVDTIYPDLSKDVSKFAILTPKNETTLQLNDEILQKLPGKERVYTSIDKAITDHDDEEQNYPLEFLHSLTPSGMPQHILRLKKGAIIMLLRNLDLKQNLCNGTRLVVKKMHSNTIEATVICSGKRVLIPRIKLCPSDANLPFKLQRLQFPVRKAWAMTIDKSQGQEFDRVGIYLPKPVFSHGQLYVAFSRAKSFKDVYVKVEDTATQGRMNEVTVTQNIVYREVLLQQNLEEEECQNEEQRAPLIPSPPTTGEQ